MMRHLVIFARAPQFGRVKRRLARDIGDAAATRFYRLTLARQIRLLRDRRWRLWLFVTPDTALADVAWRGIRRIRPQGPGDLGVRMKRPFRTLPPGPVVLVGSDIPAMRAHHIAYAFHLLGSHDFVFGPAPDGGFWLVGARRTRPLPHGLFADVRWSTHHALRDSVLTLPLDYSFASADTLDDVDDLASFRAVA
ncbi:MAG: TIGR04282 family arsenosugar biosynthesis glycosyltransferase [Reyranella sp.]|nr:TIGR04282 family arsenosugar biosynthesis glycosyltransferase [Reyranella sp.]